MTLIADNLWKFVGRGDVFCQQQKNGAYFPVKRELTTEDLEEHLAGFWSLGTYVIDPSGGESRVHFIVFDLDTFDVDLLAALQRSVEELVDSTTPFGSTAYPMLMLEASGGKGYHVWLFLDGTVEAWRVRAWLDQEFWPRWNARTNSLPLEVFPKQDFVDPERYGNLVKLPFGVHAVSGNRSELIPCQAWVSEVSSIERMDITTIPDDLRRKPPEPSLITADSPTGILSSDGPVARFIRGETANGERNLTFHAFFTWTAWNLHLPSDLAWDWAIRLNEALAEPEDDEQSIQSTLESAYSRPPADSASPRQSRGDDGGAGGYRSTPLAQRLAQRAQGGA